MTRAHGSGRHKLDEKDKAKIVSLFRQGVEPVDLATRYGVQSGSICDVLSGAGIDVGAARKQKRRDERIRPGSSRARQDRKAR